jgi:TIR domain
MHEKPNNRPEKQAGSDKAKRQAAHNVFISYSSSDLDSCEHIHRYLEQQSCIRCWKSNRAIPANSKFSAIILQRLHEAKVFLLLLSKSSVASEWVQAEVHEAFDRKAKRLIQLVQFRLDEAPVPEELWLLLRPFQQVAHTANNWKEDLDELTRAVLNALDEPLADLSHFNSWKKWALARLRKIASILLGTALGTALTTSFAAAILLFVFFQFRQQFFPPVAPSVKPTVFLSSKPEKESLEDHGVTFHVKVSEAENAPVLDGTVALSAEPGSFRRELPLGGDGEVDFPTNELKPGSYEFVAVYQPSSNKYQFSKSQPLHHKRTSYPIDAALYGLTEVSKEGVRAVAFRMRQEPLKAEWMPVPGSRKEERPTSLVGLPEAVLDSIKWVRRQGVSLEHTTVVLTTEAHGLETPLRAKILAEAGISLRFERPSIEEESKCYFEQVASCQSRHKRGQFVALDVGDTSIRGAFYDDGSTSAVALPGYSLIRDPIFGMESFCQHVKGSQSNWIFADAMGRQSFLDLLNRERDACISQRLRDAAHKSFGALTGPGFPVYLTGEAVWLAWMLALGREPRGNDANHSPMPFILLDKEKPGDVFRRFAGRVVRNDPSELQALLSRSRPEPWRRFSTERLLAAAVVLEGIDDALELSTATREVWLATDAECDWLLTYQKWMLNGAVKAVDAAP